MIYQSVLCCLLWCEPMEVCDSPAEVCFEIPTLAFFALCFKGAVSPERDISIAGQYDALIIFNVFAFNKLWDG